MNPYQRAVIQRDQAFDDAETVLSALKAKALAFLSTPKPRVVLLVDDDKSLALAFARILRTSFTGLSVVTFHTAADAEAWLGQNLPGIAILDMHLGDGVGWDLAARLPRSVKVVLMSGALPGNVLAQIGSRTGAISTLAKPIDAATLVQVVSDALADEPREDRTGKRSPV